MLYVPRLLLLAVALLAITASALEWESCDLKAGRSSDLSLKLVEMEPLESMIRGWEWSFNFTGSLSAHIIKGDVSVTLTHAESGKVVHDLTLPLCGEWSDAACALNWPVYAALSAEEQEAGSSLYGMLPVFVDEREALGEYIVRVYVRGAAREDPQTTLESCYTSRIEIVERQLQGCPQPCGALISKTPGGNGAYSNSYNMGTGESCGGHYQWGLRWQCVELVVRATQTRFPVDYAKQMCSNYNTNEFYKVSSPGRSDVYVVSGNYGHTAIVRSNNGNGYVTVTEQNYHCDGTGVYSIGNALCFLRMRNP